MIIFVRCFFCATCRLSDGYDVPSTRQDSLTVLYNPVRISLYDFQQIVVSNRDFLYLWVPGCRALTETFNKTARFDKTQPGCTHVEKIT